MKDASVRNSLARPCECSHVFGGELGQLGSWENQREKREKEQEQASEIEKTAGR